MPALEAVNWVNRASRAVTSKLALAGGVNGEIHNESHERAAINPLGMYIPMNVDKK